MNAHNGLRPQDVVVLLKIVALKHDQWQGRELAQALHLSPAEVSNSLKRSSLAGLIDEKRRHVIRPALLDLLRSGLPYVFPQRPGSLVRGVPTAHSASPLKEQLKSDEHFVWPSAKGTLRGQSVEPLYQGAVEAALEDGELHKLLALVDALRIGRTREREIAARELGKRLK